MQPSRERTLDAYRDGALSERRRERIARRLADDPDAERFLRGRTALGDLVRDAWNDGPPPPDPDRLLAALRPAMRRIDAERAKERRPWRVIQRVAQEWAVVCRRALAPAGLAAAAMAALVLVQPGTLNRPRQVQHVVAMPMGPQAIEELRWPSSVYDLAQEDVPLMVYEKGGATVFFFGGAPPPGLPDEALPDPAEDLSNASGLREGWV
jgi:hypothetical protein